MKKEKQFECPYCNKNYMRIEDLHRHIKKIHDFYKYILQHKIYGICYFCKQTIIKRKSKTINVCGDCWKIHKVNGNVNLINEIKFGKQESQKLAEARRLKCKKVSKKLWENEEYRKKVITGVSKPRSEQGRVNISKGVKRSYDKIQGLRQSRSSVLKNSWQKGCLTESASYNINKSKNQYIIYQQLKNIFSQLKIEIKGSIKYKDGKKNRWLFPDILIEQIKVVIQYYGDYWHLNPNKYDYNFINEITKCSAKQSWQKDYKRQKIIKDLGYNLLVIWEEDYKKDKDQVIEKVKEFIESNIE